MIVIITNVKNEIYDSRLENNEEITNNLALLINNIDYLQTENNGKLILRDVNYLKGFSIYKQDDLFIVYIKNKYNELVARDLARITSWLNDQWNTYFSSRI